ncbi:MAG: c-type cytochrome [Mesorhizobium sp.]|nr:MAG: c-type cytochrome [Mesorhizobium sp.]
MSMRPVTRSAIAAGFALLVSQSGAAGADQGAQLTAACASCHRLDGRDMAIPPIAGVDQDKLVSAMQAFKSGERPSQIMYIMVRSLTDEEVATVARYLSTLGKETTQP